MKSTTGLTITLVCCVPVVLVFSALVSQTALAAESAETLYKQCESKSSTADQPARVKTVVASVMRPIAVYRPSLNVS